MPLHITPREPLCAGANYFLMVYRLRAVPETLALPACFTMLNWIHLMLRPKLRLDSFEPLSQGFMCMSYPITCLSGFLVNWQLPGQAPFNLLDHR